MPSGSAGHRRALAAVEADLTAVPVVITTEDGADEVARIVSQWHENEHRAGLRAAVLSIIRIWGDLTGDHGTADPGSPATGLSRGRISLLIAALDPHGARSRPPPPRHQPGACEAKRPRSW